MAKKRKTKAKKVIRKIKTRGRKPSNKDKKTKINKLKRLARLNARREAKKSFFARLFGK